MSARRPVNGSTGGVSLTSSSRRTDMPKTLRTTTDKNVQMFDHLAGVLAGIARMRSIAMRFGLTTELT